ncbi:MAG: PIN domain-containing protein, partial [Acidimicrobiia bacterium]
MARLLYDTDVIVDHLQGSKRLPGDADVAYSVVTRAELYAGASDGAAIDEFLAPFEEIAIDRAVAEEAGRIRRAVKVKLPDALVAATA